VPIQEEFCVDCGFLVDLTSSFRGGFHVDENAVFQDLKDTFLMMAIARPVAEVSLVQSRRSRMVSRVRRHNHAVHLRRE
jgi:hypothetical protein